MGLEAMKIYYDNICKKCWHGWKSTKKPKACPKCGADATKIDVRREMSE
jgi:rubrerythrin